KATLAAPVVSHPHVGAYAEHGARSGRDARVVVGRDAATLDNPSQAVSIRLPGAEGGARRLEAGRERDEAKAFWARPRIGERADLYQPSTDDIACASRSASLVCPAMVGCVQSPM